MKKKTNKSTKRLLMSIVAMAIAIVGAATSTYAWFTMNATPGIGEFNAEASSTQGLLIAFDARTWTDTDYDEYVEAKEYHKLSYKSFVSGATIASYLTAVAGAEPVGGDSGLEMPVLTPAQTLNGRDFTTLASNNVAEKVTGKLPTEAEESLNRAFYEFNVYFKMHSDDHNPNQANIVLDFLEYGVGADAAPNTYVKPKNSSNTFVLPTEWLPGTENYSSLTTSQSSPVAIENYIKVKVAGGNNAILGINMFKYLEQTNANGFFVSPVDGKVITFGADLEITDVAGAAYKTAYDAAVQAGKYMPKIGETAATKSAIYFGYDEATKEYLITENPGTTNEIEVVGATANAIRTSFTEIDNTDLNTAQTPANAFDLRLPAAAPKTSIWDPNSATGNYNANGRADNFALHMLLAEQEMASSTHAILANYFANHKATESNDNPSYVGMDNITLCTLKEGEGGDYYAGLTIRIWIDGWDAECFNGIMENVANIAFQFTLA